MSAFGGFAVSALVFGLRSVPGGFAVSVYGGFAVSAFVFGFRLCRFPRSLYTFRVLLMDAGVW